VSTVFERVPLRLLPWLRPLDSVLHIAEMLVHLDLQTGLEHLLREPGQQTARTDQIHTVRARLLHQLLSERPLRPPLIVIVRWLRHQHILLGHDLSFPASKPLTMSGQTSYTADPTVPHGTPRWPDRQNAAQITGMSLRVQLLSAGPRGPCRGGATVGTRLAAVVLPLRFVLAASVPDVTMQFSHEVDVGQALLLCVVGSPVRPAPSTSPATA
jgi:hypothetical protein